jgi:NAD-dependent DNA ligase
MTRDDVIKEFSSLKGVGKVKAELLYDSGFTSMAKLKKASISELVAVKGITEKSAQDLLDQFKDKKVTTKKEPEKISQKSSTPKNVEKSIEEKPVTKKKTEEKPQEEEKVDIVEEEEEYKVKIKPELKKEIKKKLQIRKQVKNRTPVFWNSFIPVPFFP